MGPQLDGKTFLCVLNDLPAERFGNKKHQISVLSPFPDFIQEEIVFLRDPAGTDVGEIRAYEDQMGAVIQGL